MKNTTIFRISFFLLMVILSVTGYAQDSSSVKQHTPVKTIWDIPHKTRYEKWMWIHRSITFQILKEHPVNFDTAYITSFYKRLVITLPVSVRFLNFSLKDQQSGNKLTFSPNLRYDLGISVTSRWASFIFNTGVKLYTADAENKGQTKYQDYQLNLYGRRITTDMFVQYYSGFYIKNSQSYAHYVDDKPYSVRTDVNAIHIGATSYYIVNHRKFSYRNSFAFVEQQKKSAGSFLTGVYYSYFETNGSPSLVTSPFRSSFDTLSFIRSGHTHNLGLNLGLIYTFVFFKKCYATASLVQGIGVQQMNYERDDNSTYRQLAVGAGQLNGRLALGYDNGRYFIGSMAMLDYFLFRGKTNATFDYSFGKFMAYIGYRFSVLNPEHKLLHRLNLVDY